MKNPEATYEIQIYKHGIIPKGMNIPRSTLYHIKTKDNKKRSYETINVTAQSVDNLVRDLQKEVDPTEIAIINRVPDSGYQGRVHILTTKNEEFCRTLTSPEESKRYFRDIDFSKVRSISAVYAHGGVHYEILAREEIAKLTELMKMRIRMSS